MSLTHWIRTWDFEAPALNEYTCWRQCKRYANTWDEAWGWLRSEQDKLHVIAPGLIEELKHAINS